jgi:hypothetical protein
VWSSRKTFQIAPAQESATYRCEAVWNDIAAQQVIGTLSEDAGPLVCTAGARDGSDRVADDQLRGGASARVIRFDPQGRRIARPSASLFGGRGRVGACQSVFGIPNAEIRCQGFAMKLIEAVRQIPETVTGAQEVLSGQRLGECSLMDPKGNHGAFEESAPAKGIEEGVTRAD